MIQIRNIEGNWEVREDGKTSFYSGPYAIENMHRHYSCVDRLLDEAKAHPAAFDCKEFAPHFEKVLRFHNGSWERLMLDGTWASKSSMAAVRGCLVYHNLHLRPRHLKLMLDYLKENCDGNGT